MDPLVAKIQVPTHGKYHYFFYGTCTEDQLSPMIATAERYGCEYLSLIPMQIQVETSRLALAGKPNTTVLTIYRIFVRCPLEAFPAIRAEMEQDAAAENKKGLRPNLTLN